MLGKGVPVLSWGLAVVGGSVCMAALTRPCQDPGLSLGVAYVDSLICFFFFK